MKFKLIGSIGACTYIYDEKRGFRTLKSLISLVCHLLIQNKNQAICRDKKTEMTPDFL